MAKVPFNVSEFDLNHVLNQVGETVESLTKQELEDVLFYVGMDRKGIEIEKVLHRPQFSPNNEPWLGNRYSGFERQDREWMFSNKCSLENVIQSQTDMDHKRDLVLMSQQSTSNIVEFCETEQVRYTKQEVN